ncbi:DUF6461 domain-containing protein [Streptomyces sp. NBC_01102]|uniref:DUF6461 domain-containing protein n=1 Tax=unclassified Streptomyces TaxID=2593676 RepID=UPI0038647505|nr:DUF6461 domain-containing protein [Streptomyces sp. NBC_01102]
MNTSPEPDMAPERAVLEMGLPSFCLTYVRDTSPAEILLRLGAQETTCALLTLNTSENLVDHTNPGSLLRFGTLGSWTFCLETWGIQAGSNSGLARLTSGTIALSYLSGGDGMDIVQSWKEAQPVELFEPGSFGSLRAHQDHPLWDAAQSHRNALADPNRPEAAHESSLKAIHDQVQAHLTPELVGQALPSVWLPETSATRSSTAHLPLVAPQPPRRPLGALLGTLQPPSAGTGPDPAP